MEYVLLEDYYDVVICGGGLAGLSLARQLTLYQGNLTVAVLDRFSSDIPNSTWKVGESTVEYGSYYLADTLQLKDYLDSYHIAKLGLRFFLGNSQDPIESRPEIGSSQEPLFKTYQLDRGMLERDLRLIIKEGGVTLAENCAVSSIDVRPEEESHEVYYRYSNGATGSVCCRWLVDASGRRRILQNQLELGRPPKGEPCSSVWFRYEGCVQIDDMVPVNDLEWHQRVPNKLRYRSTNHIAGKGYWIWVIPLSGNATSVGIVAREDAYPFIEYATEEKAIAWLEQNEPHLCAFLKTKKRLDFKRMKSYSYSSQRVFSADRWSCVGEAALFPDPFYAPGLDFIGTANTITTKMIADDFDQKHDEVAIEIYSRYMITLNDQITKMNQHGYSYLGDEMVTALRLLWDVSAAWGYVCPQFFNGVLTDPEKQQAMRAVTSIPYAKLAEKAYQLFDEWLTAREAGMGQFTFGFFNYLELSWLREFRKGNLKKYDCISELCEQHQKNMRFYEALVKAIFCVAVEDIYPTSAESIKKSRNLDVGLLTLEASCVSDLSMCSDSSAVVDYREIADQILTKLGTKSKNQGVLKVNCL